MGICNSFAKVLDVTFSHKVQEISWHYSIWDTLAAWPESIPLCFIGGNVGFAFLGTCFTEIPFSTFSQKKVSRHQRMPNSPLPFVSGYIGAISYDDYSCHMGKSSRVFSVFGGLAFDLRFNKVYISGSLKHPLGQHKIDLQFLADRITVQKRKNSNSCQLFPYKEESHYINSVEAAIDEIVAGRYYQINILRYFHLKATFQDLIQRLARYSGPFGAVLRFENGTEIISFSPERFFTFKATEQSIFIQSQPIKGTRSTQGHSGEELINSPKDLSELRMIIDLLRHDLLNICYSGSVKVSQDATLVKHPTVHHLEAIIAGTIRENITIAAILQAMCPGGSITGAPKLEVMKAIKSYEIRNRGYFMGSCFYFDPNSCRFDSSILIRTVVKDNRSAVYEYAAGSGIVKDSIPHEEFRETITKCQVIQQQNQ